MEWWYYLPLIFCVLWVFALGLGIGSFLNVLIARLPFEKSVLWPGSRCMACLRALWLRDNIPILGYLRLRGRCRFCGTHFSSRYLWVELFTGLAFVALFLIEIVFNWHRVPAFPAGGPAVFALPSLDAWFYFAAHAFLLSMLIASAAIDLEYKIIPTHVTYAGTILGLIFSTLFPWPWPTDAANLRLLPGVAWNMPTVLIPTGAALWPAWQPPTWAPAGSWQLGLLTGLAGAAAGMAVVRGLKFVFEFGFGQEALGLGDADLLMMAGAFLGWQPVVLALPAGAMLTLAVVPLLYLVAKLRGKAFSRELPFGPGLAAGVVVCWLGWPVMGELGRAVLFEPMILAFVTFGMGGGLLVAGLLLRRR